MSQRPSRVTDPQRPTDIERLRRRARREVQAARQRAEEAQRRAEQAELNLLEAESSDHSEPTMAEQEEAPPAQPVLQPPAPPVLLKLADTNPYTNLSNLTSENGRRLWRQATEPLTDKFDGSHQQFQNFSAAITNRFKMCNWFRFITFTVEGTNRDLITNPGLISLSQVESCRATRSTTLAQPPALDQQTPDTINTYNNAVISNVQCEMMYHFLSNSITTPLQTHISQKIMCGLIHEDGPLLLKYIQEKVKGRANKQAVLNARSALLNLNLKEFKYNIKKLHDHVNTQVLTISSNGGQVMGDGITAALLTTYKTCTNDEFLHSVRHIEAVATDNGTDINYEDLMVKAETTYDTLVQKKKWGKKDPRDEQILALQTKVQELTKKKKSTSNNSSSNHNSGNSQKKRRYPDWRYEKPKDNKKHMQKEIKGKMVDFWWCDVLEMWARHKPDECKAKKNPDSGSQKPNSRTKANTSNSSSSKPKLQAQAATTYVMDSDDEDSASD